MTQTILQLQEAQQRNAQAGGDFLGAIIGWKIAPDIRISHPELEALALDCNVPPELLPNPCSTARAFRSAVTEVRKDAKSFNILLRYITGSKAKEPEFMTVGLVAETASEVNLDLNYAQLATVKYCQGSINSTVNDKAIANQDYNDVIEETVTDLLEEINKQYQHFQEHTSADIRGMLIKFAKRWAVRLNPSGGAYFVPEPYKEILQGLKDFVLKIAQLCGSDGKNIIYSFEMFDSPQNQSDLGKIATEGLEQEIQELIKDLDNFVEKSNPEHNSFNKGLDLRQQKLSELKARVRSFTCVLQLNQEAISTRLHQIENQISLNSAYWQQLSKVKTSSTVSS